MNQYTIQDIVTYQHQSKTAAVIKEYEDRICLKCEYNMEAGYMTLSVIKRCQKEEDPYCGVPSDKHIAIKKYWVNSSDYFVYYFGGSYVKLHDHNYFPFPHIPRRLSECVNSWVERSSVERVLPKNYMYTYEKEGWLKEVVNSDRG